MMLVLAGACLSAPNTQFRRTSTGDLERVHGAGTEKTLQMDKRSPAKATQVVPPTEMPGQFGGPARQLPFGLVTPSPLSSLTWLAAALGSSRLRGT